jgi:hypothetical protein
VTGKEQETKEKETVTKGNAYFIALDKQLIVHMVIYLFLAITI